MARQGSIRSNRDTSSMLGWHRSPMHSVSSAGGAEGAHEENEGLANTVHNSDGVVPSSQNLGTLRLANGISESVDANSTSGRPLAGALMRHRNEESDSVEIIYSQVNENNMSVDIAFINDGSYCEPNSAYWLSDTRSAASDGSFYILESSYSGSGNSPDNSESGCPIVHGTGCSTPEEHNFFTPSDDSYVEALYHPEERSAGQSRAGPSIYLNGYYGNESQGGDDADNIAVVGDGIPEEQRSNDPDIHIVSSTIRIVPDPASLPPSFFRNDIDGYDRVRGIDLTPQECRLRQIHAATARIWSSIVHSETFPSLEDFRTLSRRLIAEECIAERDPSRNSSSESNGVPSDASDVADDMFPEQPPAISQYMGPIRYGLIEHECIDTLMEKIQWAMSFGTHREAVGLMKLLTDLASFFSRSEIEYIAEVVYEEYRMEGFIDADVASIITFAYDWSCQSNAWRFYSKKKYNVVAYSQLLDARDAACHICYDDFKKRSRVAVMDCLHVFHSKCLNLWLRESPRCPLCRALPVMPNLTG